MKTLIKSMPVVGPMAKRLKRVISPPEQQSFVRSPAKDDFSKIENILNYTKTSGSSYAAKQYPAGYHTITLGDRRLRGQRDPEMRFSVVPYDFTGKVVLDIGTNQGGMLHHLRDSISAGIGIDYDSRMVNAATRIEATMGNGNLRFYTFDLQNDPLDLLQDLLPAKPDIIFLLAVCMWIRNWREVIDLSSELAPAMLFESNGSPEQQAEQIAYLHQKYDHVLHLTDASHDDPGQKARELFLCKRAAT